MSCFQKRVCEIVRQIPMGKVACYSQIAGMAGIPRGARAVGNILARCPEGNQVPCHRVVDRQGRTKTAFDDFQRGTQRAMLEAEDVLFRADGRVDLEACLWRDGD